MNKLEKQIARDEKAWFRFLLTNKRCFTKKEYLAIMIDNGQSILLERQYEIKVDSDIEGELKKISKNRYFLREEYGNDVVNEYGLEVNNSKEDDNHTDGFQSIILKNGDVILIETIPLFKIIDVKIKE